LDAGFKVYLNPSVRVAHWGIEPHYLEDVLTPQLPNMEIWLTHNEDSSYTVTAPSDWWEGPEEEEPKPPHEGLVLVR